jgi:phosphoglucomutase
MTTAGVQIVPTAPIAGQRPGTSGLRKKTKVFLQPAYLENFVQSIFDAVQLDAAADFKKEILVVGGDGRFHNRAAIQTILKMAVANGFGRVLIGRGGILSTPAMSAVIRRKGALGGILLTASHNPGGIEADFGVKFNTRNGGPAPEGFTERIFAQSQKIARYLITDFPDLDLDHNSSRAVHETRVTVFDPLDDYVALMDELFDFDALRALFRRGFRLLFDAMNGVTGPYARYIFERSLGAVPGSVINGVPLEDFGGIHPDPNLAHAHELVGLMSGVNAPDLGAACDGDGDRNMILGPDFFVTPGDSLALIVEHARAVIPGYRNGLSGVARSMPTSTAVDRIARSLGIPCFETPTGWKFFGNLMDAGMCTICGEESFGTGSSHVREKDGLWAVLCWLSILARTGGSVAQAVQSHWRQFGRSYYQRHDYEGLDAKAASQMVSSLRERLPALVGAGLASSTVQAADDFSYTDPVDGSVTENQGLRILMADGSRVVCRLSGTGTEGATLRIYLERLQADGGARLDDVLSSMASSAADLLGIRERCGRDRPTVIT